MIDVLVEAFFAIAVAILALGLCALGTILMGVGLRLMFLDRHQVEENQRRGGLRAFFRGQMSVESPGDPIPDQRVRQGIKWCPRRQCIVPHNSLSHRAVVRGLRSRAFAALVAAVEQPRR
jgi:hypothetical protein